ncbi:molybdopterin-dependent oxidoreductase [Clostridium perfringens]|uniref:molybdopterin-dependent oxidoreductase n=1 Tax=Clostridium perfringens TaxID=1502 RepID=UPI0024BD1277|nr:molybdopterin-dependent oxidoreductase [Clostridium perfringens]
MEVLSHGCTLDCFDCCKFNVYKEGSEILKIEGDKDHPFTKGLICKKGIAHLKRLNHKDRIYTSLLKNNGVWEEISFEDALEIMKEKLESTKEKYSSKSILYYSQYGSGGVLKGIEDIFFNFYGGVSKATGGPCWSAGMRAQKYDFGDSVSNSLEDMINSKNIFLWGKNPANTTIHTMAILNKAKKNGSRIIVIDPINTQSAKLGDIHVKIKPGTDGALAMAMAKIIISKGLQDEDFINKYVLGFQEYKDHLENFDLDYLSYECGIEIEDIEKLTKYYCEKNSSIYLGYGMQKYKNGGNTIRAIDALGALTGQIGVKGGGVNYANKVLSRILDSDPFKSGEVGENREFYVSNINEFIEEPKKYSLSVEDSNAPIKIMVIANSNLMNQLPNLNRLNNSIDKVEFKVCFDMFMTDTASKCDLFIPCTNTLESEDMVFSSMTNPYLIYNEKIIEPREKLMDEYYFFRELAKRMNLKGYPSLSKKDYLSKVIEPLMSYNKDITLDYLKNNPFTVYDDVAWENKKFKTPSGKFELASKRALKECGSLTPTYLSPRIKENCFRLLTNHSKDSLSSQHYIDVDEKAKVYLNENMIRKFSLICGEKVKLKSRTGEITAICSLDNGVQDYVALMYVGWWKKHGNPNFLTESGISDMGGQITYNETFIEIENI